MNFFKFNNKTEERSSSFSPFSISYGGYGGYTNEQALLLSAVYRCVEVISDSVAQLPLEIFHIDSRGCKTKATTLPLYHTLNCTPNARMSRFQFIKVMITSMLLKGCGYAYVERDEQGNPKALHFIPFEYVTTKFPDRIDLPITYSITGINGDVKEKDLIKFLNFSYDGVVGLSTISHAKRILGLATYSDESASQFFEGGCNLSGVLTIDGASTPKARQNIKEQWSKAFNPSNGTGGGLAVLEGNMKYEPISVSPTDAQLLESRQFNVIEICRFFGVNPVKIFDLSHSSYATVEATNLSFLSDTLQPLLSKIEIELKRKLLNDHISMEIKFDTSQLLRTDKSAQASYYSTLFNTGAMTVNEIRAELDLPSVANGDTNFVQVNLQSLERATSEEPADSQDIKEALNNTENSNIEK